MVVLMIFVSKYLGGNSSRYFIKQQEDLGKVDGYIEETVSYTHLQYARSTKDRCNKLLK